MQQQRGRQQGPLRAQVILGLLSHSSLSVRLPPTASTATSRHIILIKDVTVAWLPRELFTALHTLDTMVVSDISIVSHERSPTWVRGGVPLSFPGEVNKGPLSASVVNRLFISHCLAIHHRYALRTNCHSYRRLAMHWRRDCIAA